MSRNGYRDRQYSNPQASLQSTSSFARENGSTERLRHECIAVTTTSHRLMLLIPIQFLARCLGTDLSAVENLHPD